MGVGTDMPIIEDTYYLKGERKTWFWVSAGGLALLQVWSIVSTLIMMIRMRSVNSLFELMMVLPNSNLDGIQTLIKAGIWILILAAYGFNNRVRVFKVLFLVLAAAQLVFGLSILPMLRPFMAIIMGTADLIRYGVWIALSVVVLFHPKSSRLLKISSIVTLISYIISIAFLYRLLPLYTADIEISVVIELFFTASMIYFLWAMACTHIKEKEAKVTEGIA